MRAHGSWQPQSDRPTICGLGWRGDSIQVCRPRWPRALRRSRLEWSGRRSAARPARPDARRAGCPAGIRRAGGRRAPGGPRRSLYVLRADHAGRPVADQQPGQPGAAAQSAGSGSPGRRGSGIARSSPGGRLRHGLPRDAAARGMDLSYPAEMDERLGHPPLRIPRAQPRLLQPARRRNARASRYRVPRRTTCGW